jgi:RNA polymerase sigma factor (sigma-70 family)
MAGLLCRDDGAERRDVTASTPPSELGPVTSGPSHLDRWLRLDQDDGEKRDMNDSQTAAERFETHRAHLRAVAYRMLGSADEADDAVQEAWLRLDRVETAGIDNLRAWLTTVVARVCLDGLRARKARREASLPGDAPELEASLVVPARAEAELSLADSIGVALLVVLETLAPAERIAFVLHDLFDLPFDEIAPIVERSPAATRQLASRARRRVQGAPAVSDADGARQRQIVDAFLAASRLGDFGALLAALDPDVVLRADDVAVAAAAARASSGAPSFAPELRGAQAVADCFKGRAREALPALVDGLAGAAWAPRGRPRTVFAFTLVHGRIAAIDVIMDPARLGELDVVVLGPASPPAP